MNWYLSNSTYHAR